MEQVSIVGLGYVGLPLLLLSEEKGVDVNGFDVDEEKVEKLKQKESPIQDEFIEEKLSQMEGDLSVSTSEDILSDSAYYILTVPTPVDNKQPDYSYVEKATETISQYLEQGDTVILESTVAPGTCREVVKPIIEDETDLEVGQNVHLAFCPERVDPGNSEWTVENIPRVLGAVSDEGRAKAKKFYDNILTSDIFEASGIEVAEASKITENAFRDINIAFANEMAKILDQLEISAKEVIEAADTKPFGFMAHYPGAGVGGHCIPVDPYYLIEESKSHGYDPKLLAHSREVNESMPEYTVQKVMEGLNSLGKPVKGTKIALLGLAYKGGVEDTRESPALEIKEKLENLGADLVTCDPYVEEADYQDIEEIKDSECIVIATDHSNFRKLESMEVSAELMVDGRNMLDSNKLELTYVGIGSN